MEKKTIIAELINTANEFDTQNLYEEADRLTKIAYDIMDRAHFENYGIPPTIEPTNEQIYEMVHGMPDLEDDELPEQYYDNAAKEIGIDPNIGIQNDEENKAVTELAWQKFFNDLKQGNYNIDWPIIQRALNREKDTIEEYEN